MESRLSIFRMHWDHEPGSFCIAGFPTGQRADWKVGVTRERWFMESCPSQKPGAPWDHERWG